MKMLFLTGLLADYQTNFAAREDDYRFRCILGILPRDPLFGIFTLNHIQATSASDSLIIAGPVMQGPEHICFYT
jgi:hypothetical protein